MRMDRLALAILTTALLAACTDGPAPTATLPDPGPAFDSGMVGSGNRGGATGTTAPDSASALAGSGMVGSGN